MRCRGVCKLLFERYRSLPQVIPADFGSNTTHNFWQHLFAEAFRAVSPSNYTPQGVLLSVGERRLLFAASFLRLRSHTRLFLQVDIVLDEAALNSEYHQTNSICSLLATQYRTPFFEKLSKVSSLEVVCEGRAQSGRSAH